MEALTQRGQEEEKLDLDEVESIVKDAVQKYSSLSMQSTRSKHYIDIIVRLLSPDDSDAGARHARISTSGSEAFFLDLPDGFTYRDFDYEHEGQVTILHLLATMASEYLLGDFEVKEELKPSKHRRRYLEITVGGEIYRLDQRVRRGNARGEKRRLELPGRLIRFLGQQER